MLVRVSRKHVAQSTCIVGLLGAGVGVWAASFGTCSQSEVCSTFNNRNIRGRQADPLRWPHLRVAMDRGPDGCCGLSWLQRNESVNIAALWCGSHSSLRAFQIMLRDACLMPFWLLLLVVMHVAHGPFR